MITKTDCERLPKFSKVHSHSISLMSSEFVKKIMSAAIDSSEQSLSREAYTNLYEIIHRDCTRLGEAETLYFVIGNFDTDGGRRERVEQVCACFSEYPECEGFLLDDIDPDDEIWQNWYLKFHVFYERADHVVGVFEDNDGGHELEVGEVDNDDLHILKRDYFTDDGEVDTETEHERYDGMLAKLFETIDDRVYHWTLGGVHGHDNLDRATRRVAEATR